MSKQKVEIVLTSIEQAKQMRAGINVKGKIAEKGKIRKVNTRFGSTNVVDAHLEDKSGRIKLTLWAEDCDNVNEGDTITMIGGYTTTFRNEIQLNKGRKDGDIKVRKSRKRKK